MQRFNIKSTAIEFVAVLQSLCTNNRFFKRKFKPPLYRKYVTTHSVQSPEIFQPDTQKYNKQRTQTLFARRKSRVGHTRRFIASDLHARVRYRERALKKNGDTR